MGSGEPLLYVENSYGGDISVVDLEAGEEVRRIEVGGVIDDIDTDRKRELLILSRKEPADVIAVFPEDGSIAWKVDMPAKPHHVTIGPSGDDLFVPVFERDFVEVVDLREPAVVGRVPVGAGPHGTKLSADGSTLYVGTCYDNQLTLVDVERREPVRHIPFEEAVRPFEPSPDGTRMYVQLSKLHGFVVVDIASGELLERVDLPALEPGTPMAAHDTYDHGLAITPDGRYLYAVSTVADYVAIYSIPDHELVTVVPVGREPNWIEFTSDGTRALVTNREDDDMSVIDLATQKETARVQVGRFPQRMTEL